MVAMPLPKYEDWQAPWEKTGEEFDAEQARRLIYNLHVAEDNLKNQAAQARSERDAAATERDQHKSQLDAKNQEGESEIETLKRTNAELTDKINNATEASRENLKLQVALDKKMTASQAKRLVGNTREELVADADELLSSFGGNAGKDGDSGDSNSGDRQPPAGEDETPRRQPRRYSTPGDPEPDSGKDYTVEQALDLIPRN